MEPVLLSDFRAGLPTGRQCHPQTAWTQRV
jgi:hypothetical protein